MNSGKTPITIWNQTLKIYEIDVNSLKQNQKLLNKHDMKA